MRCGGDHGRGGRRRGAEGRAWLIADGAVTRGPVHVMTGDEEDPTPVGTFHEGRQDTTSSGCVKLGREDAVAFFDYLQVGDEVQVH